MNCIVSCEHATNHVPERWKSVIYDDRLLSSHSGYDIGALLIARILSKELRAPLFKGKVTRLLIDLNRSLSHKQVYSRFTQALAYAQKEQLLNQYYRPYREAVTQAIENTGEDDRVLHLSVHTFTPRWQGKLRSADIGLLYDPARKAEASFCSELAKQLKKNLPQLRIRRNYPYRGSSDGFTTSLRRRYSNRRYLGVELEFNQVLLQNKPAAGKTLALAVADSLAGLIC